MTYVLSLRSIHKSRAHSMNIQKSWEKALKYTEIIRTRIKALSSVSDTTVPYIMLSESKVNESDTVVRKGAVVVQKPSIILPPNLPYLEGFDFKGEGRFNEETIMNFLLVRGVQLPSLKYQNKTYALDVMENRLKNAIEHYNNLLQKKEDVHTGLVVGPDDCWSFCLLIFICSQVARNAETDINKLLNEFKKQRDADNG